MAKRILLLTLFFVLYNLILAQGLKVDFKTFTTQDGLADNNIHCIIQDSRGFMWFGSEEGLHRYDGYNLKVYRRGDDGSGISNNFIRALYEDKFGRLWIGTNRGGITVFDIKTETFRYVRYNPNDISKGLISDEIYCFSGSKDGGLWVGTKAGLSYLELNSDENSEDIVVLFKHYRHNPDDPTSLPYPHVYSVLEDSKGVLWAGTTEGGLGKLLPGSDSFINYMPNDKNKKSISGLGIMTIYEDSKNNIWVGTWAQGLNLYNKKTDSFTKFYHSKKDTTSLSHNNVYSICEDQYKNLWIATYDGGINKLVSNSGKIRFQRYATQTSELMSFYKNRVKVIYTDNSCSLWAGTLGNGITQLSQMPVKFKQLTKESNSTRGLIDNTINCIYPLSNDSALIGTKTGLQFMVWSPQKKPTNFRFYSILNDSYATPNLNNKNITSVIRDSKENYWVGTEKDGLFKFKLNGKNIVSLAHYSDSQKRPYSIIGKGIVQILEHHNRIFVLTSVGVCVYSSDKNRFVWKDEQNEYLFVHAGTPKVASFDSKGRMYVGTQLEGLYAYNVSFEGKLKVTNLGVITNNSEPVNLSSNDILSLADGGNGRVWVGTAKGLHLINIDDNTNISYKEKDGLPSASVTQIFKDNKGYNWFATIQGLGRMDKTTNNISPFYMSGGFISNYFSPSKIELINNKLAFLPSKKGILYFFPDSIKTNPFLAKPTITDLQISGQSVLPGVKINNRIILNKTLDNTKEVVLRSNENIIKFEFSGLTFYKQKLNKFAYKLEGLENDWNYTNANHRTVTYSNLSPKEYTFRVVAANSDGVWNPEETALRIVIKPPFYKTVWAYLFYILILLFIFLFVPRFIINRIRLQENLKQEKSAREKETALNQMKLKFFTNISHEFRTPLSLISGPLNEILSEKEEVKPPKIKSQLEMIKRNTDRLLRLINQLMDFRKVMQDNMKLKIQKEFLSSFVIEVADSFMGAAVQKHINFQTDIEEQYEPCWFDHSKVETILFNLLSNAFKHTPKNGNILLELSYRDEYADITVSDSGPGVKNEDKDRIFDRFYQSQQDDDHGEAGTGIGLSLVKELVELHKGSVSLSDENESGASFKLDIGISKHFFSEDEIIEDDATTYRLPEVVPIVKPESNTLTEDKVEGNPLILVVEDNPDVMQYLKDILSPYFNIETAFNGVNGMEKASATLPALIVSDVMMPGMDGFSFCKNVKENFITSHIPVILLTALDSAESKIEGSEQGADAYITKPFDKNVLISRINNLIQTRRQLKARFTEQWDFMEDIASSSADKQFIKRAADMVEEKMHDPQFNVSQMVSEMKVSRTLLHMKLRELTGQSTSEFIRTIRLKQAARLLKSGEKNVSEVTYAVGFNDPKYFSKSFKNLFGLTPTLFQKGDASIGIKTLLEE